MKVENEVHYKELKRQVNVLKKAVFDLTDIMNSQQMEISAIKKRTDQLNKGEKFNEEEEEMTQHSMQSGQSERGGIHNMKKDNYDDFDIGSLAQLLQKKTGGSMGGAPGRPF